MSADMGYGPKPTNTILVAGYPLVQILKVKTAATMYAGRLVERDTTDGQIKAGTAGGAVIGWLGYEQTIKKYRPATVTTLYVANDHAAVLTGGNFVIVGNLASGQNVTKGARLMAAASGELTAATAAAPPSGTVAMTSTSAQATMAGPLPTGGIVVAIAEESVDASAAAKSIMVRSLI